MAHRLRHTLELTEYLPFTSGEQQVALEHVNG